MKKTVAFLVALILTASSLHALSVQASTYAVGDVDMDGKITGHDAAVISRFLADEEVTLTTEQEMLADVNGDGSIDADDATMIYANQTYALGDVNQDGRLRLDDVTAVVKMIGSEEIIWTADGDGDGDIDLGDYWVIMGAYGFSGSNYNPLVYSGQYYYSYDIVENESTVLNALGDIDNDGKLTGHDSAMITRYVIDNTFVLTENQLVRADVNIDGIVDKTDAQIIMMNQQYMLGDVNMDGVISIEDVRLVLGAYASSSVQITDIVLTEIQKNLADVDVDEYYEIRDSIVLLTFYACDSADLSMSKYAEDADYYYMAELLHYLQAK